MLHELWKYVCVWINVKIYDICNENVSMCMYKLIDHSLKILDVVNQGCLVCISIGKLFSTRENVDNMGPLYVEA